MKSEKIAMAIRREAEKQRASRRRPPVSVQGRIKAHLEEIMSARPETTWDGIAAAMCSEGLAWANGKPVTGKQLRTIVSRLITAERKPSFEKPEKSPPSVSAGNMPEQTSATRIKDPQNSPSMPDGTSPKNRIMDEVRRATMERK